MNMQLDKAGISRGFTDAASTYDKWAPAQLRMAGELARRIPESPPRLSILDLGCGTGALVEPLMQRFPSASLLGLDLAAGMIDFCRNKWANNPKIEFEHADAESFVCTRTFDLICASSAFQWFDNPASTAMRWVERLCPCGLFATAALVAGSFDELNRSYTEVTGRPMRGLSFPQPADVEQLFAATGLSVTLAETEQVSVSHADACHVLRSFSQTGATFRHHADYAPLPAGTLRQLIGLYEKRFGDSGGRVPVTYHVLYLLAEAKS